MSFADRRGLRMTIYKPGNEKGQSLSSVQAVALCSKYFLREGSSRQAGGLVTKEREVSWLSFPTGRAVLYPAQ